MRILNIIQNLSYRSDECDSCSRNTLFMTMLDACLSDFLSLLRKICLVYHKTLTCSCTCSEYNFLSNDSAFCKYNMSCFVELFYRERLSIFFELRLTS